MPTPKKDPPPFPQAYADMLSQPLTSETHNPLVNVMFNRDTQDPFIPMVPGTVSTNVPFVEAQYNQYYPDTASFQYMVGSNGYSQPLVRDKEQIGVPAQPIHPYFAGGDSLDVLGQPTIYGHKKLSEGKTQWSSLDESKKQMDHEKIIISRRGPSSSKRRMRRR